MKKLINNRKITLRREVPGTAVVLSPVEVAEGALARTVGLLGRRELADGAALLIVRCRSIHTFFMQFAIDAAFVDETYRVVDVAYNLPPGRFFVCRARPGRHVLEVKGGFLERHGIEIGDCWNVV